MTTINELIAMLENRKTTRGGESGIAIQGFDMGDVILWDAFGNEDYEEQYGEAETLLVCDGE